jgi:phosphonate transport system substrate-binding protein
MRYAKRLAVLTVMSLMLTLLAACGDNTSTTAPAAPAATTAAATTAATTSAATTAASATTAAATAAAATTAAATTAAATTPSGTVVGAAAGLVIPAGAGTEAEQKNLVMALVPSRQSDVIQTQADKIANFISTETGYIVKAVVVQNYAAVGEGMGAKNIDIGWVGPLDYVISNKKFGVYPITGSVRRNTLGYKAFVVARTDSGIKTLADLKGKTVCLGDAISASSNLYPSGALAAAGLKAGSDYTVRNISNQSAIAIAVQEKGCDAGAFYDDARTNKEVTDKYPNVLKDTQIIYTTELIPADPQIVRKDLNAAQVKKIYDAMIKLSNDPNGKQYLKDLFTIDGLASVNDASYEGLRKVIQTVKPDLLNV